jgi:hypothetical protein
MSVRCAIGGHRPAPRQIYNSGYYFSACARCGRGLVRPPRGIWQTAPSGHRIVWKSGRHCHSIEADYADVLPIVVPRLALPAPLSPFASWRRDLMRLSRRAGWPVRGAARAIEESGEPRYPRLLLMAVMVGAGVRMLLSLGAAR